MKKMCLKFFMIVLCFLLTTSYDVYATNTEIDDNTTSKKLTLLDMKEEQSSILDDYQEKYSSEGNGTIAYILHYLQIFMLPLTYIIGITCLLSLILNCIRRNIGKAIFSGVGLIIPIITYVAISYGKLMFTINRSVISLVMCMSAVIVNIIIEILALTFCFAKNKNKLKNA